MIPIMMAVEPANFDSTVRRPGQKFLSKIPNPTSKQWKGKEYWQRSLPDMRTLYNKICAYSACWIPHSTGSHSIDHFVAKTLDPNLAYEWHNFRYVSTRFNSRKGVDIIADPFNMQFHWFILDFTTFFVKPNSESLNNGQLLLANNTISVLKLNTDDELIKERQSYYEDYNNHHIDFDYLKRKAPFIAFEMQRQNLI